MNRMRALMAGLVAMISAPSTEASPLIAAHRGLGPWTQTENSLSALREAIARDIDVVEIDLRRTADGQVVVLHDAKVDRTTSGTGRISRMTLDQAKALTLSSGEPIPTLGEALALARGTSTRLLLDIKHGGGVTPEQLIGIARDAGMIDRIMIGARSAQDVGAYRRLGPELYILGFVERTSEIDAFIAAGASAIRLWPKWIDGDPRRPNSGPSMVSTLRDRGVAVWILADAPADCEAARIMFGRLGKLDFDAILTDRPDLAAANGGGTVEP